MKLKLFEGITKAKISIKAILFGKISSPRMAEAIIREVAKTLFIFSTFQVVMGVLLFKVGGYALLVDAAVFFTFGFFLIRYMSRAVATALLILAIFIFISTCRNLMFDGVFGAGTNLILSIIVLFVSIRGVQSTYYYQRQQK